MSKLTSLPGLPVPSAKRVAEHNYRRLGSSVLMTNEAGNYAFLSPEQYRRHLAGGSAKKGALSQELLEKGFFRDYLDFDKLAARAAQKNLLTWKGPNVHTMVLTLRCNFKCVYCHASVVDMSRTDKDMSLETARDAVDVIFQSPSPDLMIEFQGGEPLLNWPVLQFITSYARKKNEAHKKDLHFGLISNFSLLDDEKIDFLMEQKVSFCTSLDGPEELHNKNRVYLGGNTHAQVVAALKKIMGKRRQGVAADVPNAIATITRFSLPYPKEIVDQLVGLGLERVQLGPLDRVGFARKSWETIGCSSKEFVEFYGKALDHILELNRRGVKVYEKMAMIFLIRILEGGQWRFPNADGLARLAYNYDGGIYPSEDARLLANEGDDFFKIGQAGRVDYAELLDHPMVKASLLASGHHSQPQCFQCAYHPYCSVVPAYNYQAQDSLWGNMPENAWCEKMMGVFDILFKKLQDPGSRKILESWLEYKSR